MRKYELDSKGIPLFVDVVKDMPARQNTSFDSWYVICNFEHEGKQYGFEWHQQSVKEFFMTVEYLMMDADRSIYSNNAVDMPICEACGHSYEELNVFSPFGTLTGDRNEMKLNIQCEDGAVDVVLRPRKDVLYNGTCGMLKFLGGDFSYQYSFPNMDIEGTMTLKGKTIPITNTTAWFDRQWGVNKASSDHINAGEGMNKLAWLWLGMTLEDGNGAVSLWDSYGPEGRNAFATIMQSNGIQYNAEAEVTYEDVWTSAKSGNSYPRAVNFNVPKADLAIRVEFISDDPEFFREGNPICGCPSLCKVTGSYKGEALDRCVILELINDVNGEI